jgi:hypothetical protein
VRLFAEKVDDHIMLMKDLQDLQHQHGYRPRAALHELAERLKVPFFEVFGVASFYPHFRSEPPTGLEIRICTDLSCHLAGAHAFRINNVEIFAFIPAILPRGAQWFHSQGQNYAAGLKFLALSGHVQRPGVYEVPFGLPAATLIFDHGRGLPAGQTLKAFSRPRHRP